jgi:hypothetical protein
MSTLTSVAVIVGSLAVLGIALIAVILTAQPRWWIEHRRRSLQRTLDDIDEKVRRALISGDRAAAYLHSAPREYFANELARLPGGFNVVGCEWVQTDHPEVVIVGGKPSVTPEPDTSPTPL